MRRRCWQRGRVCLPDDSAIQLLAGQPKRVSSAFMIEFPRFPCFTGTQSGSPGGIGSGLQLWVGLIWVNGAGVCPERHCRAAAMTKLSGAMHSVSAPLCGVGEEP